MINIQIQGLDPFVVGHYSKEHTSNIAQLFYVEEDDVSFYAPGGMMFHLGTEQTSWDILVIIKAPVSLASSEEAVKDYILSTLTQFAINVTVIFEYFESEHLYQSISKQYPRFITADQIQEEEEEEPEEGTEVDVTLQTDNGEVDINDPESIYLGNAFEGFEEALEEASKIKK